ncbi:uncharacterized protein LOC127879087 [Dreissena polymorpha]|uniref:VWFA domain-containing protein n=1 Tax=Dreissena polymorpha TaxID=45954 RepID=A0A9D4K9D3_DREPO|nr:uncharacterized protein LOC127879087 [Dreissena polymorpha]KAH3835580.1 hypothetical protein DPMN_108934 [Dreissena polymorpha]
MESQNMADIKEIKTTTEFILKRLDNLTGCGEDCTCSSEIEQLRKAFQTVEERLNALQINAIDPENEETEEPRFVQIQTRIDELRQSLIALRDNSEQTEVVNSKSDDEGLPSSLNGNSTNVSSSVGGNADHMGVREHSGGATNGTVFRVGESSNYPLNVSEKHTGNETMASNKSALGKRSTENVSRRQIASTTESANTSGQNVIRQTHADHVFGDGDYWKYLAENVRKEAHQLTSDEETIRTVLCLDISESMASGNAWSQAKTFVNDFLNGLEMLLTQFGPIGLHQEYVGLATFGHETKHQILATANYASVRDKIENFQLGGPSPLFAGLWFSLAGAKSCRATASTPGNIILSPRIIVITDGKPTETSLRGGPDIQTKKDETMTSILGCLQEIEEKGATVFFVGVGDYDKDFLKLVTASEGRKKLFGYQDGRRLAKRTWLCTKTTLFEESSSMRSGNMQSSEDYEDMQDIRLESMTRLGQIHESKSTAYFENENDEFPCIGSRVRRGPDWMFDDQDNFGPGTVVGHSKDDYKVWVTWDFDNTTAQYRYGVGEYDVLLVDEPRELKPREKMAVGCRVKPSRDARSQDLSGSIEGVVIRVNSTNAEVRWDNGKRGDYSYGADGRYEIELCASYGQSRNTTQGSNASASGSKTRSNKNKNKTASS